MRILLAPSSYPPVLGGVQTVAHTLARHLGARGHEIRVVTHRYPRSLPAREWREGVPVQRWLFLKPEMRLLKARRPDLFLASLGTWPGTLLHLAGLMRAFRPQVVNVHFPDAQTPFVLALRRCFPFRLVVSLHGHDVARFFSEDDTPPPRGTTGTPQAGREALRAILREADAVTACSRHLLAQASRLEPSVAVKGLAIYNGVDPDRFADKSAFIHPRPYLLACGRLTRAKGFDLLIEALSRVQPEYGHVDLLLAGEGEEGAALHAQAQSLGVAERVHCIGRASPDQVVRLLNGCLFVVVPSRQDAFGIVALEALAAGKRVLATRVGGMAEFMAEAADLPPVDLGCRANEASGAQSGPPARALLVEPSAAALAGGLRACLGWLGAAGFSAPSEEILSRYSWSRAAERYEAILAAAGQSGRGAGDRP